MSNKTPLYLAPAIGIIGLVACTGGKEQQPELGFHNVPILNVGALQFKDLNRNGRLDVYEDWRKTPQERARNLVSLLPLKEKIGLMFHATLPNAENSTTEYDLAQAGVIIKEKSVNHLITRIAPQPARFAEQNNKVQELAEATAFGIPVSISTDPRHHYLTVAGASVNGNGFSQWPETLGFAALNDPALTKRFAEIAGNEYRAVGIHIGLSPQADLATEPRWPRNVATFGSNPDLVSRQVKAYIEGFQTAKTLNPKSVAMVVKHWVGYGAQPKGFDAHNYYGRFAVLNDDSFARHVKAFDGAFKANVAGVMPTYPILKGVTLNGRPLEEVGAGFSKQLLTDLLRKEKGFKGIILSDWAITKDCNERCMNPTKAKPQERADIATSWGVQNLSVQQRYVKGLEAGLDQFGGTDAVEPLLDAVNRRLVDEARINDSAERILLQKFELGLFENPYVNADTADRVLNNAQSQRLADEIQRRSHVMLENNGILPLNLSGKKVYLHNVDTGLAAQYGFSAVKNPAQADIALVRADAPFELLHPYHFFGRIHHEGRLDFKSDNTDYKVIQTLAQAKVPTVISVYLDRPAILTDIKDKAAALMVNFGTDDAAFLDVVAGKAVAQGKLPFELPSSMQAVEAQDPSVPDDSKAPLYPFGYGL